MTEQPQPKKIKEKPEIERVNELMAQFKLYFKSRNFSSIKKISNFKPGRERFLRQFIRKYSSLKIAISDFKFSSDEHHAAAKVQLSDLIDTNGQNIKPGTWSKFEILAKQDRSGEYRLVW